MQYPSSSSSSSAPISMHHPTNNHFVHSELNGMPTTPATATTASSSASSSFGYTLQELDNGMTTGGPANAAAAAAHQINQHLQQHHPFLPSVALNESSYDVDSYPYNSDNSNNNGGKDMASVAPGYLSLHSVKVEPEH
ncbi:hypothetical protein BGX24_006717 [Mortierella sp. AD032]|nr:hypothetical protein BGX24_006717 [Mortierella sp. AD032]